MRDRSAWSSSALTKPFFFAHDSRRFSSSGCERGFLALVRLLGLLAKLFQFLIEAIHFRLRLLAVVPVACDALREVRLVRLQRVKLSPQGIEIGRLGIPAALALFLFVIFHFVFCLTAFYCLGARPPETKWCGRLRAVQPKLHDAPAVQPTMRPPILLQPLRSLRLLSAFVFPCQPVDNPTWS